jgi:hypothetical protein
VRKEVDRLRLSSDAHHANALHSLAEQYIPQGTKYHHQEDEQVGFEVQTSEGIHRRQEPSAALKSGLLF